MLTEDQKGRLVDAGWTPEQIEYVEGSIVEVHIIEMLNGG